MNREPDFLQNLRVELSSGRAWLDRAIVLGYAVVAGLFVVAFTIASDWVFGLFNRLHQSHPWAILLWTPLATAAIVWTTRRWFPGAAGSGIPQVKAALHPALPPERRSLLVSLRLTVREDRARGGGARRGPVDRSRRPFRAGRGRCDATCKALVVAQHPH